MAENEPNEQSDQLEPSPQEPAQEQPPRKSDRDRLIKAIFLLVVIMVGLVIYYRQMVGPSLPPGWSSDLDATLAIAGGSGQRVIVFFRARRPDEDTRRMITDSLAEDHARKVIDARNMLRVVVVTEPDSPIMKKFDLKGLPAVAVLSSAGKVIGGPRYGFTGSAELQSMIAKTDPATRPGGAGR